MKLPYGVIAGVNQWNMMLAQVNDQPNAKEMRQAQGARIRKMKLMKYTRNLGIGMQIRIVHLSCDCGLE